MKEQENRHSLKKSQRVQSENQGVISETNIVSQKQTLQSVMDSTQRQVELAEFRLDQTLGQRVAKVNTPNLDLSKVPLPRGTRATQTCVTACAIFCQVQNINQGGCMQMYDM